MKKIIIIMLFGGFLFTAFSQTTIRVPVITDSTYFYADQLSETITLGKNEFLSGSYWELDRTATIRIQVFKEDRAAWFWLNEDDAMYIHSMDSTVNNYVVFPPWLLLSAKKVRFWISKDPTDTLVVPYEKRTLH